MKVTLSKAQMLERCRLVGGLEPLRSDASVEYTDGIDIDAILESHLRSRYLEMLDSGRAESVAADDISATVRVSETEVSGGGVMLTFPSMCRRVLSVSLRGWERHAAVLPETSCGEVMQRQLNRFTRATARHPVAVRAGNSTGGSAGGVLCWPSPGGRVSVSGAIAVTDPGPDYYTLDEVAVDELCRAVVSDLRALI